MALMFQVVRYPQGASPARTAGEHSHESFELSDARRKSIVPPSAPIRREFQPLPAWKPTDPTPEPSMTLPNLFSSQSSFHKFNCCSNFKPSPQPIATSARHPQAANAPACQCGNSKILKIPKIGNCDGGDICSDSRPWPRFTLPRTFRDHRQRQQSPRPNAAPFGGLRLPLA